MSHAHALVIKTEAHHNALALLLAGDVGFASDEPRLVGFDVGTETALGDAEITRSVLSGAEAHLVTVERQARLGTK